MPGRVFQQFLDIGASENPVAAEYCSDKNLRWPRLQIDDQRKRLWVVECPEGQQVLSVPGRLEHDH